MRKAARRARMGPRMPSVIESVFDDLDLEGVPEGEVAAAEVWEEAEWCRWVLGQIFGTRRL